MFVHGPSEDAKIITLVDNDLLQRLVFPNSHKHY